MTQRTRCQSPGAACTAQLAVQLVPGRHVIHRVLSVLSRGKTPVDRLWYDDARGACEIDIRARSDGEIDRVAGLLARVVDVAEVTVWRPPAR